MYVKGLSIHTVRSVAQCERIVEAGCKNRSVGCTLMNKDSSRSHSIFTISIEIYAVGVQRADVGSLRAMASPPLNEHVFLVESFDLIQEFGRQFHGRLCRE